MIFFVKYLTIPRLSSGCGANIDEVKCIGVKSYVAAEVLPEYKELTIKRGSSAIAKVMLIHAATSLPDGNYYPELTLVMGGNKTTLPPEYIYYDDPPQREKVVVLKANQTKVIPVTIQIPESFPEKEINKEISLYITLDIAEQSVPGNSAEGIGARDDIIKVKVLP